MNNNSNSPFGAGWGLSGLQHIVPQADGSVILTEGNRTIQHYRLQAGQALRFDGLNDLITIGYRTPLIEHTLEAWIKYFVLNNGIIFGQMAGPDTTLSTGTFLFLNSATQEVCYEVNPQLAVVCTPIDSLNTWTHVAGTYDGNSVKLYLDGALKNETSGITYTGGSQWMSAGAITFLNFVNYSHFAGEMDELRAWNYARSEQEINDAMFAPLTGIEPGLSHYFALDEQQGQQVIDSASPGSFGLLGFSANVEAIDPIRILSDAPLNCAAAICPYKSPEGEFSTLIQNPDNTFTRTMKDGTVYQFDALGRQTSMVDRNGNTTNYNYDSSGLLTSITIQHG